MPTLKCEYQDASAQRDDVKVLTTFIQVGEANVGQNRGRLKWLKLQKIQWWSGRLARDHARKKIHVQPSLLPSEYSGCSKRFWISFEF